MEQSLVLTPAGQHIQRCLFLPPTEFHLPFYLDEKRASATAILEPLLHYMLSLGNVGFILLQCWYILTGYCLFLWNSRLSSWQDKQQRCGAKCKGTMPRWCQRGAGKEAGDNGTLPPNRVVLPLKVVFFKAVLCVDGIASIFKERHTVLH